MKKLSFTIFLIFFWCNIGFAKPIDFSDLKIGEKVSKYFNEEQISKFYMSDRIYYPDDVIVHDKDKKYSYLQFLKADGIFDEKFPGDAYQVYYENKSKKLVGITRIMDVNSNNECFQKRKTDVDKYKNKNRINSLFNRVQDKHTFPDGMIDDYIMFSIKEKYIAFSCYIFDDKTEYRVEALENNYNDYIFKINNQ